MTEMSDVGAECMIERGRHIYINGCYAPCACTRTRRFGETRLRPGYWHPRGRGNAVLLTSFSPYRTAHFFKSAQLVLILLHKFTCEIGCV